ncbi:AMP-binding protein [Ewingella americana]
MDSEKMHPACLSLPMKNWLDDSRDAQQLVSWCDGAAWDLATFRRDVLVLIRQISPAVHQRWALCFTNNYHFAVALLAVLYCGRVPVLPGHSRQAQLEEQRHEFDVLLTDQPLMLSCPVFPFPSADTCAADVTGDPLPIWREDLFIILFTSGSSGLPQKVIKPVRCLEAETQWLAQCFGEHLNVAWFVASVAPHHMYGLTFGLMLPLSLGRPFYAASLEYHEQLVALAQQLSLAVVSSPSFLQRLDSHLSAVNCEQVFSAGGTLLAEDAGTAARHCGTWPVEIYGTTETGVIASRRQQKPDSPWTLFEKIQLMGHADGQYSALSDWIPQPDGVFLGDTLHVLPDGKRFELAGRKDRIVKIAEQRISLSEIERRLLAMSLITDASVLTLQIKGRVYIAAAVVLKEPHLQDEIMTQSARIAFLRHSLRDWLPAVAIPRFWRFVPAIPLNSQGKRTYAELQDLFV